MIRLVICALLVAGLAACTGTRAFQAVPRDAVLKAEVPGYDRIRQWGDAIQTTDALEDLDVFRQQVAARARAEGSLPNDGRVDILLLSGGGSDGAFGAGLLNGWTDRGGRPEFTLVTGISTGALIAPFAFLGSAYDNELERFYTNTRTDDVVVFRLFKALTGDLLGLADTTLLTETLDRAVTPELVDRIAEEHAKGRRLLVGTTNLDAQRPVVWDVGAIAVSGRADRRTLIRDVLMASAAIPGAFPPVQFVVEAAGQRYTEMHVDGGVTRQLFFLPRAFQLKAGDLGRLLKNGTIYAVRNTKLDPDYEATPARVVEIAARSISTLIKSAGVADVNLLRDQARAGGFRLAVTAVPEDFDQAENELFDPAYMRALYKTGYKLAFEGNPWTVVVDAAN